MNVKIRVSKGLNEAANQYIYIQRVSNILISYKYSKLYLSVSVWFSQVFKYEIAAMDDNSVVYQSTAHQTKKKSNLLKYMIGVLDIS